jgi:hypothetical protein
VQLVAQQIEMGRLVSDDGTVESGTNGLELRCQSAAIGELEQADPLRRGSGHHRPERTLYQGADDPVDGHRCSPIE